MELKDYTKLEDIRTKFVDLSGRTDLVKTVNGVTYVDNGADFFINAGQRVLDTLIKNPETIARYISKVDSGGYNIVFQDCRSVKEVWMANVDGRFPLEKKALGWIRENYKEDYSALDTGQPLYWAPGVHKLPPSQALSTGSSFTGYYDYETIQFGLIGYNSVIFVPPADGTYTVNVFGDFFSGTLVDSIKSVGDITFTDQPANAETFVIDTTTFTFVTAAASSDTEIQIGSTVALSIAAAVTVVNNKMTTVIAADGSDSFTNRLRFTAVTGGSDGNSIVLTESIANATANGMGKLGGTTSGVTKVETSWWSEIYPDALVYAALYSLETFYRNTEGAKDWMNSIRMVIDGIDKDMVEQEVAGLNQIAG